MLYRNLMGGVEEVNEGDELKFKGRSYGAASLVGIELQCNGGVLSIQEEDYVSDLDKKVLFVSERGIIKQMICRDDI